MTHKSPGAQKAETKRQQAACASPAAYDHLKNAIFDEAIARRTSDPGNLNTLADYSVVRMENPVVESWDPSLDLTRCKGRIVLEVPPGAEKGLGGERQLEADIRYTAQASADGAGLVYQASGTEPIVAKLAAFKLSTVAYRPPPAIDQDQVETNEATDVAERAPQAPPPAREVAQAPEPSRPPVRPANRPIAERAPPAPVPPPERAPRNAGSGEATVRAFYGALGTGNGAAASSQVIPEKRSGGPYSPGAISRFYGRLPEPLRLSSVTPMAGGTYRVTYRYSAGRSHCNGTAIVRLTNRGGRNLISSIRSQTGC